MMKINVLELFQSRRSLVFLFSIGVAASLLPSLNSVLAQDPSVSCDSKTKLFTVAGHPVWKWNGLSTVFYKSGMTIDADGAPKAYHPHWKQPDSQQGLDYLENAGRPGNWWALVTDNGRPDGNPVVQKDSDPAPGFYISMTALEDGGKARTDPHKYVDSSQIPYIVLPDKHSAGAKPGDFAVVYNRRNGQIANAIYADVGPSDKIGEGSIALAEALGIPSSPKTGGVNTDVMYVVFPGSGNPYPKPKWPRSIDQINTEAQKHFKDWGGMARLNACFK
jgi:hypothetical protein